MILLAPHELVMLPTNEQVVIVKSVYPFKIPKFELEKHPNFKQSADGDGKRLIIQNELDLADKIARIEAKRGIEAKKETQEEINRKAQQPVDGWMNKQPFTGHGNKNKPKEEKEDEFFF